MNYIVMREDMTGHSRPTFFGPFSSFGQACDWAKVDPVRSHELETDGLVCGIVKITIRAMFKP